MTSTSKIQHWGLLFSLIFAGEMIFSLPFHVARFFRPTLLEVFSLTNTQLGDTFAFYGITAMLSYFPGGVIADYFSARKLLTISLISTALGGFVMMQIPQGMALTLLFGYWGITSILLFWAGMIKATREWGGHNEQGKAFGLLDGGRGLVAALMSTIAVSLLSQQINDAQGSDVQLALKHVILFYTAMTFLAGMLLWHFIPEQEENSQVSSHPLKGIKKSIMSSKVWLQAMIVICAYSGFKGADNYGLYAVKILHMNQVESATFTSFAAYLRPIGAIAAGFLADKIDASRVILYSFIVLMLLYLFSFLQIQWFSGQMLIHISLINLSFSFLAVFALRGVYFALVEESKIQLTITGTAVGFISFIGYTPDVFFASITGRVLDNASVTKGFENYFLVLMFISFLGLLAAFLLNKQIKYQVANKIS